MSTQTPFECIDSVLHKYNHGLNSDYNGEFLHCMRLKSNGFDENDIEYELGRNRDPTQCSYVWRFRVVIPSYVHIPRGKEGSFTFYILQYAYLNKECPSKSYIQHLANTLLHSMSLLFLHIHSCMRKHCNVCTKSIDQTIHSKYPFFTEPNSDDRLPQICDACIDLVIDTEDPQLADHPRSIRFQQSARDMKIISCICNEETSPETCEIPLIQLVAIYDANVVQSMNDLVVRTMLDASHHGYYNVTECNAFRNLFIKFVRTEVKHHRYDYQKLHRYIRALFDLSRSRYYGYSAYKHIMNDLSSETEEKNVHADDVHLPYHVSKVQSIFGAFIAYARRILMLRWGNVDHCAVLLMLRSDTAKMDNVSDDFDYYIDLYGKHMSLDTNCIDITDGLILYFMMNINEDGDITLHKDYEEETQVLSNEVRPLANTMRAKDIVNNHTNCIGLSVHKSGSCVRCYIHNIGERSAMRFEPQDFSRWFPRLFQYRGDKAFNTAFYERFWAYLGTGWGDTDPCFEEMQIKFNKMLMQQNTELFGQISGIQRIDKQPTGDLGTIFNAQTMTKVLHDSTQPIFGDDSIEYLNTSTPLQWLQMNRFTVQKDCEQFIVSFINNELHNAKMQRLYTLIIPSPCNALQWVPLRNTLLTARGIFKAYGILKHELPQTNALLQNLRKRYMIPKGIAQLQWFQDSLQRVVSRWNQKKNVKRLDYHTLHALFVNHSISENYHSDHVVHCLYTFLIKNGYKTSRSAVERIWNAMDPSQDDYRSNKLCDELLDTNICKVKDWKEQYVHGYIHETLLPQGHIDERIRNWGDYTRKWLCVLGEHVITKYKDKNDVRIEITNYNLHRNEQPIYVVKEGSKHYLKTASQLANAPSLPKRPPKPLIIPDEKQRDDIVDVWKSGEGCKVWVHGTIKWNQMPIYGTQNQAMSYICTYTVGEFEKQIKRFIEGNPQIRIEPVPRFDRSMWEWLIDWVLIVGVDCCMPSNETCECDIGIAVYALNGELHPTAIYLSIYDRQRLWGMDDTQDTFREIHNLRIGGSCKALVKDQRDKPKFL
eukprot:692525_1